MLQNKHPFPKLYIKLQKFDEAVNQNLHPISKIFSKEINANLKTVVPPNDIQRCKKLVNLIEHSVTTEIKQENVSPSYKEQIKHASISGNTIRSNIPHTYNTLNNTVKVVNSSYNKEIKKEGLRKANVQNLRTKPNAVNSKARHFKSNVSTTANISDTTLPKAFTNSFEASPKSPFNKVPKYSDDKPDNYMQFDGAAFLYTQIHTNTALQSILNDIATLSDDYQQIDENSLDKEIQMLRAKNNLPSLKSMESLGNSIDSDIAEDLCPVSDDQESVYNAQNSKDNERVCNLGDNEGPECIDVADKRTESVSDNDEGSGKLVIDESGEELDDEPEYVVIETLKIKEEKHVKKVLINGDLLEIDQYLSQCPLCSILFKSVNLVKKHLQFCPKRKQDQRKNLEENNLHNFKVIQLFSTEEKVRNELPIPRNSLVGLSTVRNKKYFIQEKKELKNKKNNINEGLSNFKIAQVFSAGQEIALIETKPEETALIETKQEETANEKLLVNKTFIRKCKQCGLSFYNSDSLKEHFETSGHARFAFFRSS